MEVDICIYIQTCALHVYVYIHIPSFLLHLIPLLKWQVDNHPSEEDNLKNPKKPSKFSLPSFPSFSSTHKNPENDINEKEKLLNTDEVYSNFSHRKENYSNMEESSGPGGGPGPGGPGSTGDGPIGLQNVSEVYELCNSI
jgi:hypothetical protein